MSTPHKEVPISPLTGLLDLRSQPAEIPYGHWRWRQNLEVTDDGSLCRARGWRKFMGDVAPYQNHDFHNQVAEGSRQPVTLLAEAVATNGVRQLVLGTQTRLATFNPSRGNWRIISHQLGGDVQSGLPERRWQMAQVNDVMVFTNGFDAPVYHLFDGPSDDDNQSVSEIASLDLIGLSRASTVYSWKKVIFFGDVVMDGERVRHRVVWSDLNEPLSFDPGDESIAGFQDLDYGERILRFIELGDYLLILTTRGIWQCAYVGGEAAFSFLKKYSQDRDGDKCLAYPNTLATTGGAIIYAGIDGIYTFSLYDHEPVREEWLHLGSKFCFDDLNPEVCEGHVGHYSPRLKRYLLSWVGEDSALPEWTLVARIDKDRPAVWYEDFGATAFLTMLKDARPDLEKFVIDNCICDEEQLDALSDDLPVAEVLGTNCTSPDADVDCSDVDQSTYAWTAETMLVGDKLIENYLKETPDDDSMCAFINALPFDAACNECNQSPVLIHASASDYCLKEYGAWYYRESCTAFTACGTYTRAGYDSVLRTGPIRGATLSEAVGINRLELIFNAEAQTLPSEIDLRVGRSGVPSDPNDPTCAIVWRGMSSKQLSCPTATTATQHATNKTVPFKPVAWAFVFEAKCLYLEFTITGTGGAGCFSSVTPFLNGKLFKMNYA